MHWLFTAALFAAVIYGSPANARVICTLVSEVETGKILIEEGDCNTRVTPASTFKVPLALMGFESKFLKDAQSPTLSFKAGDPDWGGDPWRQDTTPKRWMTHSVVWYSQRITHALGLDEVQRYAKAFGYGNSDFSGDPGMGNGLDRAWIASSLKISPREQVAFLSRLVKYELPISRPAMDKAMRIVASTSVGNWQVWGKTGAAYPRRADQSFDYDRGWGWFVGWSERGEQTLVFAYLTQTEKRSPISPGIAARSAFLEAWPNLSAR